MLLYLFLTLIIKVHGRIFFFFFLFFYFVEWVLSRFVALLNVRIMY